MNPIDDAEAILTRGHQAKALIDSPAYVAAMQDLEVYHVAAFTACLPGPHERDTRDHHHLMLHALRELATQLAGYVQAAAEVQAHLDEQEPL